MKEKLIYGIQQIGVGVTDADAALKWYATKLGADVVVFDDSNEATYMAKYMGGQPRQKRALMAMNLQGGAGYEIWHHTGREPLFPLEEVKIGDYGISIAMVKSRDVDNSYKRLKANGVNVISDVVTGPDGKKSFYFRDPYDSILQVKEFHSWHMGKKKDLGGLFGCVIGVSDIDQSLKLYKDILGYDHIIYDETDEFEDVANIPGGKEKMRRVLLTHSKKRTGGFSRLLGDSQLELVQTLTGKPNKIFEGRYWGDIGFIHVCFDIKNMKELTEECAANGFPFSVLSNADFDMGEANGHWGYLEDPDGTLVEFVETHKVPLSKGLNWNIDLTKRNPLKPLPKWLTRAMAVNKVKFK